MAVKCISALAEYGNYVKSYHPKNTFALNWGAKAKPQGEAIFKTVREDGRQALLENEAKQLFALHGAPVSRDLLAKTADEAVEIAAKAGGEVVLNLEREADSLAGRLFRSGIRVLLEQEPDMTVVGETGSGFVFENALDGSAIPVEFIDAIEQGCRESVDSGHLGGYPVVDVKVTLFDGSYHEVDSSEMAFKIAGSMALQAAAARAGVQLLEPIMAVEVVTPEDYMGDVIGDLNSRRGRVQGMDTEDDITTVKAQVPLADLPCNFPYKGRTKGRFCEIGAQGPPPRKPVVVGAYPGRCPGVTPMKGE